MDLKAMIAETAAALLNARREGILLEATMKDAENRYSQLQGRLAALQEIERMIDEKDEEDAKKDDARRPDDGRREKAKKEKG